MLPRKRMQPKLCGASHLHVRLSCIHVAPVGPDPHLGGHEYERDIAAFPELRCWLINEKSSAAHGVLLRPDLLYPEGWWVGDRDAVLRHVQGAPERRTSVR